MAAADSTPSPGTGSEPPRSPIARRWWLNALLVVIVAALAVFAWHRSGNPPPDAKPALTQLDPETIRRVEIVRANQEAVVLERADAGWRLTAPLQARADSFAVDSLLRLVRAPVETTVASTDTDLARYGLERPSLSVRFDDTEVRFGDPHPIRGDYYVQHGPDVRLISNRYYAQAATSYTNFIDSRLFEPGRELVALKLPGFTLIRKDGAWQRQPEIAALSSDRINAFIDDWRHARALQVKKHSGPKPSEQVEASFEADGARTERLRIGVLARRPELILVRFDEGLEYHFPEETGQRLFRLDADAPK